MRKKTMLRLVVLALAAVLLLAGTALAADTYTITINNATEGYTYAAYQVFSGNLSEGVLSNIQWGTGVIGDSLLSALKDDETISSYFADCENAADVAEVLATSKEDETTLNFASNSANLDAFAAVVGSHLGTPSGTSSQSGNTYTITGLDAGYYFVKNTNVPATSGAYTKFILNLTDNTAITPKADVPKFEKKVQDINDSTETTASGWQDSADHDIGDTVNFQLKATLPSNLLDYSVYKVVFTDTLSKGFTYDGNAVVTIGGTDVTGSFTITPSEYSEATGTTITFSCNDIMAIDGITLSNSSVITIEYTATLNDQAVLGSDGNPNVAKLEYSNNPNYTGEGSTSPTGETPEDKVIVFTYKTVVNKVTKNPNYDPAVGGSQEYIPLTGAEFTLEKYDKATEAWNSLAIVKNDQGTTFTFTGLDDGLYRLTETTTPTGYNTIDPIYFTITATHDTEPDNPKLTDLTAFQTDESGTRLTTGVVATFTRVVAEGSVSTNIVNNKGTTLPETGGMGTTIFYVVGGLLVVGAVVLLITKKRMSQKS